ncbi:MAG: phosphotransferase [Bacteroidales bacterium]|nr:phosphotransferase [Bacteroidales bacterium]
MLDQLVSLCRKTCGTAPLRIEKLGVSGSHRQYYRLYIEDYTIIGVIGNDPLENKAFISLSRDFRNAGVNVPGIIAVSDDSLCYLQYDLGNESLYDDVAEGRRSGHYSSREQELLCDAIACLPSIQYAKVDFSVCHPVSRFDAQSVDFDLNYFKYCFLKLSVDDFDEVRLQADFDRLRADLLSVRADKFMYRDFQPRNIMMFQEKPFFIDFQGGRRGPVHYDVASFICQASARYDDALKSRLVRTYLLNLSCYEEVDEAEFLEELNLFVLFRLLQVLGCYGFRGLWEKKQYFIDSIPPALAQIRSLLPLPRYPYLSFLLETVSAGKGSETFVTRDNKREGPATKSWEGRGPEGRRVSDPLPAGTACHTSNETEQEKPKLEVTVYSFSFKKGIPEDKSGNGGGFVFDCRAPHNPGRYEQYKNLTGKDAPVIEFLERDGELLTFLCSVYALVDAHAERFISRGFTHMQVSFDCTGGQHRSVYSAEHLASHLKEKFGDDVIIDLHHRELEGR